MQYNGFSKNPEPLSVARPVAVGLTQSKTDFKLEAEAVAKRAYFNYINEGSIPGRDEKHWLEAEAHLLAELLTERKYNNPIER